MKTKVNAMVSIIPAATKQGLEIKPSETIENTYILAEEYLTEHPVSVHFEHCKLSGGYGNQYYSWSDGDNISDNPTGEIFDFGDYRESSRVYFRKLRWRGNVREFVEDFQAVNYFDLPEPGDECCKEYVYVFDKKICADGSLALLYDYFK